MAAGVDGRQVLELGRDGNRVENFGFGRNLIGQGQHESIGIAEGRWRVTGGAASHPRRRAQANVLWVWGQQAKIVPIRSGKCEKCFSLTPQVGLSKNKSSADLSKQLAGA